MKYVKPILENEKSHSVDWSTFPTLFKVVNKQLDWHDDLSQEQRDAIEEMCNQLCVHATMGLAGLPCEVSLVTIEITDGSFGSDAAMELAQESQRKSEAGLSAYVFPTQTGDAEFDAMYPDEKFVDVGYWFDVDVDWKWDRREESIEQANLSYRFVNVMVEGSWEGYPDEKIARKFTARLDDASQTYSKEQGVVKSLRSEFGK